MTVVRPKKFLGQHFLHDKNIAEKISMCLSGHGNYKDVLEIGPGTGVLTKYLLQNNPYNTLHIEIDAEAYTYLCEQYPSIREKIILGDFLKFDIKKYFKQPFAVIGNFPYNISSQILFKVFENRDMVPELVGMFQKEVAERIASKPGSKKYGILSVLLQAFYEIEYLFTVSPNVFYPPPKVQSAVIRLKRNARLQLPCDANKFTEVVKKAFNQRRKTLRNSLKALVTNPDLLSMSVFNQRPEQLSVEEFIEITKTVYC
ncbi:MAG: 16S rRNA (adenine(1518)-N(6)/adenine(1519)-N(6))-dimethyltransferase RsmA [Bacteroidales bacterium]|jgi:16S rRNA (adenine1518-N6/adenine1519-N6)-dimethyltransferase|nr:16S rRNA (adenine(1518)-N(6)/adenine(1519)-N(6))-dimethyltransferase RsmA [Bacteroidales bacterium]MDD4214630.1 16S rRNA (adenine(1518)-N(6)/adenine(1519)-N(6))-dimethyltransferase RsmA [Bacteroidales bacterium]